MASSKAAGRPPQRGRTEALLFFFFCYCYYFGGSLDLTSREIFLHASGIHDSVDLLAALAKCIVDSCCVIFKFFFYYYSIFPINHTGCWDTGHPPCCCCSGAWEGARRSWRSSGEGLGAACDHGSAEARCLRLEVLLGSRDGFMQNCTGAVHRFRPHILEFL